MAFKMFRYLEKYVGTYRVKAELDPTTGDFPRDEKGNIPATFDDLYIPCNRGVIKHSYDNNILVWCCYDKPATASYTIEKIKTKYPDLNIKVEDVGQDVLVYFNEADFDKIAKVVGPKTLGKTVKPYSRRNTEAGKFLENYKVPDDDLAKLNNLVKDMTQVEKMHFFKTANKEFDKVIQTAKGKKFNIKEEREDCGYDARGFIHYIGMWDDYLKFIKKELKKR